MKNHGSCIWKELKLNHHPNLQTFTTTNAIVTLQHGSVARTISQVPNSPLKARHPPDECSIHLVVGYFSNMKIQ